MKNSNKIKLAILSLIIAFSFSPMLSMAAVKKQVVVKKIGTASKMAAKQRKAKPVKKVSNVKRPVIKKQVIKVKK